MATSTTKKIYNLQEKVEILLIKYPSLRDCDKLLAAKMWEIELRKQNLNLKTTTISIFLSLYQDGKLSNAELISRSRRKLQQTIPELRGDAWDERHSEGERTRRTI